VVLLPLSLFRLKNHVSLSRGVQVAGAAWQAAMKIVAGVGDLVQRTMDGPKRRVLGGRTIEKSGDAVCGLHHARGDEERGFLGSTSKPRSTVFQWFGLKTIGTICQWFYLKITGTVCQCFGLKTTVMVFSGLASKSMAAVFSDLASKSVATVFSYLISKSVATISWLSFKEKLVEGFLVWASKSAAMAW
jgi:hypothetical protein